MLGLPRILVASFIVWSLAGCGGQVSQAASQPTAAPTTLAPLAPEPTAAPSTPTIPSAQPAAISEMVAPKTPITVRLDAQVLDPAQSTIRYVMTVTSAISLPDIEASFWITPHMRLVAGQATDHTPLEEGIAKQFAIDVQLEEEGTYDMVAWAGTTGSGNSDALYVRQQEGTFAISRDELPHPTQHRPPPPTARPELPTVAPTTPTPTAVKPPSLATVRLDAQVLDPAQRTIRYVMTVTSTISLPDIEVWFWVTPHMRLMAGQEIYHAPLEEGIAKQFTIDVQLEKEGLYEMTAGAASKHEGWAIKEADSLYIRHQGSTFEIVRNGSS
ncbi:hypothetical protein F8S13_10250 [Chloroflexia bacterium SDU3-3]|nr:hypothetical protein F8S13_10250 [Chloroflexia bacterium SDU3-3]